MYSRSTHDVCRTAGCTESVWGKEVVQGEEVVWGKEVMRGKEVGQCTRAGSRVQGHEGMR